MGGFNLTATVLHTVRRQAESGGVKLGARLIDEGFDHLGEQSLDHDPDTLRELGSVRPPEAALPKVS